MKILLIILSFFFPPKQNAIKQFTISDISKVAATPFWTKDNKNNPVLCWTEKDSLSRITFYYSISTNGGKTFGEKKRIPISTEASAHAEGMPKLAFKADGTMIASYEKRRPTKDQPRASDFLYIVSDDNGKSWSAENYFHKDTTAGVGHSFGDISRLANGEIGAVWLDASIKEGGRNVKFSQTTKGNGFGEEILVDSSACQCCRTDVFAGKNGNIHLVYRDIHTGSMRDMSQVVSVDGGQTFTKPTRVFADNWQLNGCPHTGPTLAETSKGLYMTWFTGAEKKVGIKVCEVGTGKVISAQINSKVRFPHLVAVGENLAWVWAENYKKNGVGFTKIGLQIIYPNGKTKTQYLGTDDAFCNYPNVISTPENNLLLAYEHQIGEEKKQIKYQLIMMNEQ